jgi:hypothetical protein
MLRTIAYLSYPEQAPGGSGNGRTKAVSAAPAVISITPTGASDPHEVIVGRNATAVDLGIAKRFRFNSVHDEFAVGASEAAGRSSSTPKGPLQEDKWADTIRTLDGSPRAVVVIHGATAGSNQRTREALVRAIIVAAAEVRHAAGSDAPCAAAGLVVHPSDGGVTDVFAAATRKRSESPAARLPTGRGGKSDTNNTSRATTVSGGGGAAVNRAPHGHHEEPNFSNCTSVVVSDRSSLSRAIARCLEVDAQVSGRAGGSHGAMLLRLTSHRHATVIVVLPPPMGESATSAAKGSHHGAAVEAYNTKRALTAWHVFLNAVRRAAHDDCDGGVESAAAAPRRDSAASAPANVSALTALALASRRAARSASKIGRLLERVLFGPRRLLMADVSAGTTGTITADGTTSYPSLSVGGAMRPTSIAAAADRILGVLPAVLLVSTVSTDARDHYRALDSCLFLAEIANPEEKHVAAIYRAAHGLVLFSTVNDAAGRGGGRRGTVDPGASSMGWPEGSSVGGPDRHIVSQSESVYSSEEQGHFTADRDDHHYRDDQHLKPPSANARGGTVARATPRRSADAGGDTSVSSIDDSPRRDAHGISNEATTMTVTTAVEDRSAGADDGTTSGWDRPQYRPTAFDLPLDDKVPPRRSGGSPRGSSINSSLVDRSVGADVAMAGWYRPTAFDIPLHEARIADEARDCDVRPVTTAHEDTTVMLSACTVEGVDTSSIAHPTPVPSAFVSPVKPAAATAVEGTQASPPPWSTAPRVDATVASSPPREHQAASGFVFRDVVGADTHTQAEEPGSPSSPQRLSATRTGQHQARQQTSGLGALDASSPPSALPLRLNLTSSTSVDAVQTSAVAAANPSSVPSRVVSGAADDLVVELLEATRRIRALEHTADVERERARAAEAKASECMDLLSRADADLREAKAAWVHEQREGAYAAREELTVLRSRLHSATEDADRWKQRLHRAEAEAASLRHRYQMQLTETCNENDTLKANLAAAEARLSALETRLALATAPPPSPPRALAQPPPPPSRRDAGTSMAVSSLAATIDSGMATVRGTIVAGGANNAADHELASLRSALALEKSRRRAVELKLWQSRTEMTTLRSQLNRFANDATPVVGEILACLRDAADAAATEAPPSENSGFTSSPPHVRWPEGRR